MQLSLLLAEIKNGLLCQAAGVVMCERRSIWNVYIAYLYGEKNDPEALLIFLDIS